METEQTLSEEVQIYDSVGRGAFRGTCYLHLSQEIGFLTGDESSPIARPVLTSGGRYWTYDPSYAVSFAYARALETRTVPIVICRTEDFEKGQSIDSLDKLKLIVVNKNIGLDVLIGFYKTNLDRFPKADRREPAQVQVSLRSQFEHYPRFRAERHNK